MRTRGWVPPGQCPLTPTAIDGCWRRGLAGSGSVRAAAPRGQRRVAVAASNRVGAARAAWESATAISNAVSKSPSVPKTVARPAHTDDYASRTLGDPRPCLEHIALKAGQIEAAAGAIFVLDPQRRHEIERQERQSQHHLVLVEVGVGQVGADRLLKLAQPIFERPPLAIVRSASSALSSSGFQPTIRKK